MEAKNNTALDIWIRKHPWIWLTVVFVVIAIFEGVIAAFVITIIVGAVFFFLRSIFGRKNR